MTESGGVISLNRPGPVRPGTVGRPVVLPGAGRELSVADGTLTPTLKLRRRAVAARCAAEVEALYAAGPGRTGRPCQPGPHLRGSTRDPGLAEAMDRATATPAPSHSGCDPTGRRAWWKRGTCCPPAGLRWCRPGALLVVAVFGGCAAIRPIRASRTATQHRTASRQQTEKKVPPPRKYGVLGAPGNPACEGRVNFPRNPNSRTPTVRPK